VVDKGRPRNSSRKLRTKTRPWRKATKKCATPDCCGSENRHGRTWKSKQKTITKVQQTYTTNKKMKNPGGERRHRILTKGKKKSNQGGHDCAKGLNETGQSPSEQGRRRGPQRRRMEKIGNPRKKGGPLVLGQERESDKKQCAKSK